MKIGIDPEFFILDELSRPINAIRVLPGNNHNPLKKNGINFYHDNVLAEFNFQPVNSELEFTEKITNSIAILKNIVNPYNISAQAYGEFDRNELSFPNAKEVGCNPDYDAYTLTQNDVPRNFFTKTPFRAAGGHIHIGGTQNDAVCHPFLKPIFVFMLDLFVGIPSVMIDNSALSYQRRKMFGKAGCHRDKPYGIEYRVLSPFWLRATNTALLIYRLVDFVFKFMNDSMYKKFWNFSPEKLKSNNPETAFDCWGYDAKAVKNAIDNNDVVAVQKFFNFISNYLPDHLVNSIIDESKFNPDKNISFYW